MKKICRVMIFLLFIFLFNIDVLAREKINIYFFHGDGCPHCAMERKYLKKIEKKYKNIEIKSYEVWNNKNHDLLLQKVKKKLEITDNGVPLTIIGSTYMIGYLDDDTGLKLERILNFYQDNPAKYNDVVKKIKNNTITEKVEDQFKKYDQQTDKSSTLNIPLLGKINMKDVSISTAAALIGLIDGFNPCAMWVLIFLISMLLGMKNRKRMWILGITFLSTSALIYMMIMLSWINVVVNVSTSILFRNIIALVALIGSLININSFVKGLKKESGCEVVSDKKRKKVLQKIKKFTTEKSLLLALLGIMGLAISVNIIELACSAGLPLVFTQILAMNKITGLQSILYTLVYILFFLIDDIIVFIVAMVTTKITAISTKYNKFSHLLGGILMLIIGLLLIFKPQWIMFNFN